MQLAPLSHADELHYIFINSSRPFPSFFSHERENQGSFGGHKTQCNLLSEHHIGNQRTCLSLQLVQIHAGIGVAVAEQQQLYSI